MNELKKIITELGISKVKLAKYLGVSRQMLYNYLNAKTIDDIPKEKFNKVLGLLDVSDKKEIAAIKLTNEYIGGVEERLNEKLSSGISYDTNFLTINSSSLTKEENDIINDINKLLIDKLGEHKDKKYYNTASYLYNFLQAIDNNPELNYVLAYFSKSLGFTEPGEYVFDEKQQFIFESIMYSGMNLYSTGGASKSRISEIHAKFVKEIEHKKEERLSRTQELNTIKVQALRELGYKEINKDNSVEVIEKIAEIQSRRV